MKVTGRTSAVRSLLPEQLNKLLDVGCGPISENYPYASAARQVTCIDWNLKAPKLLPANVECMNADFTSVDLPCNDYDSVIAADVFEHIPLEQEAVFVSKCISVLRPGGKMVVSVPHQGTFACLDPYQVKPAIHRVLARMGLYDKIHNGFCDIRKGHKHYSLEELADKFKPLQVSQVLYFGYLFEPLVTWATALTGGSQRYPGYSWLQQARRKELDRDCGQRSFNIVVSFRKL